MRVPRGSAPRSWVQGIPHMGHWVRLSMTDTVPPNDMFGYVSEYVSEYV